MAVSVADIVPGNINYLKQGNEIPADMIEVSVDLKFDRSILTGLFALPTDVS